MRVSDFVDRWFKVTIIPRNEQEEVEYTYKTGLQSEVVRREVQESLGNSYVITAEPIKYSQIISELENVETH
jgi:hypothetical protein